MVFVVWLPEKFDEIENPYYGGFRDSLVGAVSSLRRCKAAAVTSFTANTNLFALIALFAQIFLALQQRSAERASNYAAKWVRAAMWGREKTKNDHLRKS